MNTPTHPLSYGSVCSGIEAATVAWHPLGWQPAWFSEIERLPCAVLAHHYPRVPSLGDMTGIAAKIRAGTVTAPDILVGGTPCQAFSTAGRRHSLADARGNLTLAFVELAHAIDQVRAARGEPPVIVVWENVPGVLSTTDNAFGCFWLALPAKMQHYDRQGANGRTLVLCMDPAVQSHGGPWTPNISSWHNDASVCSLSQVLETGSIPPQYYLSGTACAGILRRAERRKKTLPEPLRQALAIMAMAVCVATETTT